MKITNKELQRMRELMGNKKSINENINLSNIELKKKAPNGKIYGVVKEIKKYFIKESTDGINFDFIGGVANKTKNQYNSFEEAVRRLNLMIEDSDVLTPDIIEEKKFVIKTKKKKIENPTPESTDDEAIDFDFGGAEDNESSDFDFGGDGTEEEGGEESGDFDFDGEEDTTEGEETEETDEDLDLEDDSEDSIKVIQRMTGKLGQKLRDTEDKSSDLSKWVAKSVLSALSLEDMDSEDKKDLIRTIKKKKDEGSDEEFDFMDDEKIMTTPIITYMSNDDMVDWGRLSDEEKAKIVNHSSDDEIEYDGEDMCSHCGGMGHDDMTGEECEWCMGTGVENMEDFMEDDMYGPGNGDVKPGEVILDDEDNCSYCGDRSRPYYEDETEMGNYPGMQDDWMSEPKTDFMSRFAKNVKRAVPGKKMDVHEIDSHLKKIQNKLGGASVVHIDDNKVVGSFGYVEVKPTGYILHKEGSKFGKPFGFEELGKLQKSIGDLGEDYMYDPYMEDPYMMPQPAPARPQERPETPVKPGRPDTDRPSPSKRPFTPPPHITPGEEPGPKAWEDDEYGDEYGDEYYGPTEGMSYMEDDENMEMCQACGGRGHEQGTIGFGRRPKVCITCAGLGQVPRMEMDGEVDEPYIDSANPMGYQEEPSSTLPKGMKYKLQYKEKFNFPFNMGENSRRNKKTLKEDHINNKMVSYEQEVAYEDVEDMARQHGMDVEFCHKDRAKDPEEQTVYLDLIKKGKAVAKIRINSAGDVEMGHMTGKVFKGEPVDSHSDFDEVLREKRIKTTMSPAPAPSKPQTRPETPVKPGRPDTDRPSPSKRPFTPPPHITPGEEPGPKAGRKKLGTRYE
jgi:hypothetical protein